jgi:methylglyoxal synthase
VQIKKMLSGPIGGDAQIAARVTDPNGFVLQRSFS